MSRLILLSLIICYWYKYRKIPMLFISSWYVIFKYHDLWYKIWIKYGKLQKNVSRKLMGTPTCNKKHWFTSLWPTHTFMVFGQIGNWYKQHELGNFYAFVLHHNSPRCTLKWWLVILRKSNLEKNLS